MEKNGYPNAKTVKDDIQARIDEQKGMVQNEMPAMPSGNGNIPLDLQGLG
jgi:hypothetical protein